MSFLDRLFGREPKRRQKGAPLRPGRPMLGAASQHTLHTLSYISRALHSNTNPVELLETIATYNPDASHAIWNFIRLVNPEHEVKVLEADGTTTDDEGLQQILARTDDVFGEYGRDYGGGLDALIDVLTLTLLIHGAVAGELEVSENLKDVLDWCPVSPKLIEFVQGDDGHYSPAVTVSGKVVFLPSAQFRYVPLDPTVTDPRGRGPLLPLFESVFFLIEVLRDVKAVAHTQGHPRLHFKVIEEVVMQHVPAYLKEPGREEEKRAWMDGYLSDMATAYNSMQPDDAIFTYDWVTAEGVRAGEGSFRLDALVKVVEQQVITSLKQLPALLGRMDGSGLAHGTIQWQVYALTIRALRKKVSTLVDWWITQTLRIWGRNSIGKVTFPSLRTQDRVREAQAKSIEIKNAVMMYLMGWEENDTLAQKFTGHNAVRDPIAIPMQVDTEVGVSNEEGAAGESGNPAEGRQFGIPSSSEGFNQIPQWMRGRVRTVNDSVLAHALLRRNRAFQDVLDVPENGNADWS